jgi:hypothetical protein
VNNGREYVTKDSFTICVKKNLEALKNRRNLCTNPTNKMSSYLINNL